MDVIGPWLLVGSLLAMGAGLCLYMFVSGKKGVR